MKVELIFTCMLSENVADEHNWGCKDRDEVMCESALEDGEVTVHRGESMPEVQISNSARPGAPKQNRPLEV